MNLQSTPLGTKQRLKINLFEGRLWLGKGKAPFFSVRAMQSVLEVGDNVGDIAGMGADLFGSFAESTCAALVIAAAAVEGSDNTLSQAGWDAFCLT